MGHQAQTLWGTRMESDSTIESEGHSQEVTGTELERGGLLRLLGVGGGQGLRYEGKKDLGREGEVWK